MERHRDECDNPLDELSPTVRQAVEAVRNQPPPNTDIKVAFRQAKHLQYESLTRRLTLLVAACFVLALGVGLWAMQQHVDNGETEAALIGRRDIAQGVKIDVKTMFAGGQTAPDGLLPGALPPAYPAMPHGEAGRGTTSNPTNYAIPAHGGFPVTPALGTIPVAPGPQPKTPSPQPSAEVPPPLVTNPVPGKDGAKLNKEIEQLSSLIRDEKFARRVNDLQSKKATEGLDRGEAGKLARELGDQLKAGVDNPQEKAALMLLQERLEEIEVESGTDQHEKFIPNPFLRAADNPLSTFSIDVDTASYSLMRRYLKEENRLPPQDAIRIEELVNYFDYSYPQPKGEHPISVTPEVSACPWHKDHRLVRIAVQAKKVDPENLPPRNLVFLIDVSGSMNSQDKLPLVKQSLGFLIDQLTAKDKVAIVVYAGQVGTALESTSGNEKEKIRQAVEALGAGGSTNGAGGIQAAYEEAHKNFIPGGVNRVILATDGDFNVGISSQGALVRMIEEKRDKGIFLTALGYGMGNLKDTTIMKLADHGHGHYAYVDSLAEARKIFVEEGAALITLAKDVKIQVEFNPKTVAAYKLIGYEKRLMAAQDFNDDTKLAGVMGCGHKVTALYEIVPAGKPVEISGVDDLRYQQPARLTKEADSGEMLTVKVRYKDTLGDKSQLLLAPVADKGEAFDKASADFRFAAAVAAYAILLRDKPKDAGINLAGVAELAESAQGKDTRGLRKEFVELVKKADDLSKAAAK